MKYLYTRTLLLLLILPFILRDVRQILTAICNFMSKFYFQNKMYEVFMDNILPIAYILPSKHFYFSLLF